MGKESGKQVRDPKSPDSTNSVSPIGRGLEWSAKITVVGLEMVLPGIAGQWMDQRLGTSFLGTCGFVLGLVGSFYHLLRMTTSDLKRHERKK